ncbi:helix-turn-helix domain-containing protein [Halobacterium yunchengense]|uniref:helix-turn-helix domain-containing protein n=1 Tax=Halobacterium yunchengense TaxID=3108497 RepID=UPI00300B4A82
MKYARVTVQAPPEAASAVHRAAMDEGALGDAYLLFGGIEEREPTQFYAVEGDRDPLVAALDGRDAVSYHDVAGVDDDYVYVYTQETATEANRRLRATFTRDSLVTTLPVVYRADGTASFTVVGAADDLADAVEDARTVADLEITRYGDYDPRQTEYAAAITDRQREVVEAAVDLGYYDVPKTASQADVADALDCAASTAAEHLRKAEAALARAAVRTRLG